MPHSNDMTALADVETWLRAEAKSHAEFVTKMQDARTADYKARGDVDADYRGMKPEETTQWRLAEIIRSELSRRATAAEGVDAARNLLSLINADSATFRAMTQDMRVEMVIVLTKLGMAPTTPAQSIRDAALEEARKALCPHCRDPWQQYIAAPNGEFMHRAKHGCEIVWSKCEAGKIRALSHPTSGRGEG